MTLRGRERLALSNLVSVLIILTVVVAVASGVAAYVILYAKQQQKFVDMSVSGEILCSHYDPASGLWNGTIRVSVKNEGTVPFTILNITVGVDEMFPGTVVVITGAYVEEYAGTRTLKPGESLTVVMAVEYHYWRRGSRYVALVSVEWEKGTYGEWSELEAK